MTALAPDLAPPARSIDPSTAEVVAALSIPSPTDPASLGRRRFLQGVVAAGAMAGLPAWTVGGMPEPAGASSTPVSGTLGILVNVTMAGGNDGLNTVVPVTDGIYRDRRRALALSAEQTLRLDDRYGLHPGLGAVKQRWDAGEVAVIQGVGQTVDDLSHFTSMARWMSGRISGVPTTGWLGRFLDAIPGELPIPGVTVSESIPLTMLGRTRRTTALPERASGLFAVKDNPVDQRQYRAIRAFAGATGLGSWADALGATGADGLDLAGRLRPLYPDTPADGRIARKLEVVARLINAGMGIRVFSVLWGDFDSHSGQPRQHDDRMAEFDEGLRVFFSTLDPAWASQVVVLTQSEFGRRLAANDSDGTDHGAASTLLAIGARVRGGFYGEQPSLTRLTRQGNLVPTVDFRQVQATVLDDWLDADSAEILGAGFPSLGFLSAPGGSAGDGGGGGVVGTDRRERRHQLIRLYLAYFLRLPDRAGLQYWLEAGSGQMKLDTVSQYFARSEEFVVRYGAVDDRRFVELVYENVLGRTPDPAGFDYWRSVLQRGHPRGSVMVWFSESEENIRATRPLIDEYDRQE